MHNLFNPIIKIYKAFYFFAYDITGNYGISLVLLSFFTFIVLYPFNKKVQTIQNREHKVQGVLSPQIEEIKRQYSGREQYENLQWLYRRYGYHPLYAIRSALGFILQIPFLTAAYYMLSELTEIQGISWGIIHNLGAPDQLLSGINVLPFIMTMVTVIYAFVMPEISKKERIQTVGIGIFFLVLLYSAPSALLVFWTCNLIWSLLDCVLSKKLQWLENYVAKNEVALHVIITLALTISILVPFDIYIRNASQLWFSIKDIFKYLLLDTVQYFGILFLLYLILWRKYNRYVYLSILLGLLFGMFLQSYIIGLNYGTFDGHEIKWGEYTWQSIVNSFIWLGCLGGAYIVFYRLRFDEKRIKRFVRPVSFFIIAVQCAVLLFSLVKNPIQKDIYFEDGKAGVLTTKNLYTISDEENIIVFLLDAFDASTFEEVQKRNPERITGLRDFVYYPDVISSFGFTHYSLPEILTAKLYNPQGQFLDYLKKAWKDNFYYEELKEKRYSINIYTNGSYVDKKAPVDNLITERLVVDNKTVKTVRDLVKFRIMPHCLKKYYYTYYSDLQHDIKTLTLVDKAYQGNDFDFYKGLKNGLKQFSGKNVFQFFHLRGLHEPYKFNENMELIDSGKMGTKYKQALGVLKIVEEYITQMRKYKVYDNATIVVLADHGTHNSVGSRPVFLIKHPGVKHNNLVLEQSPTTVSQLMPLIFRRFDDASVKKQSDENSVPRYFYFEDSKAKFIKYLVNSPARDIKSWINLGMITRKAITDRIYTIGDVVDFTMLGNASKYKGYGWKERDEIAGSAVVKNEAELIFDIKNKTDIKGLIIKINGFLYSDIGHNKPNKTVNFYVNNNFIGSYVIKNYNIIEEIVFKIDKNYIKNDFLVLRFFTDNSDNRMGNDEILGIKTIQFIND